MNLAQKMLAVAKDVSHIAKDVTVSHYGANYKGLSHDGVVAAVRDAMIKHGVLALPSVIATRYSEVTTKKGAVQQMIDVDVETTFINAEKMDERLSVITTGSGIDAQDKHPGKAMSYAKKYGLLYAFLLITGENDEARPSEEITGRRTAPTGKPSDKQKKYLWSLIKKQPENEQADLVDRATVCRPPSCWP